MEYSKSVMLSLTPFNQQELGHMAKKEALARLGASSFVAELGDPVVRWNEDGSVEVVIPYNPKP